MPESVSTQTENKLLGWTLRQTDGWLRLSEELADRMSNWTDIMTNICDIVFLKRIVAACAGAVAAIFWWRASRARTPSDNIQAQLKAASGDVVHVLDRLMQDVASQSRLNGRAAILAAVAVILQIISFLFAPQACWGP
jgi:hypothetical protein